MTWSALLVDDEPLARRELRSLLAAHPSIAVVGEASSVRGAAERLRLTGANLVLLDVQLKGESGFDLLPHLAPDVAVIFVTAHDRFAVDAFRVRAFDYLLKPVAPARLAAAVAALGTRSVASTSPDSTDPEAPADALEPLSWSSRLFLRLDDRMGFLSVSQIRAVLADGDRAVVLSRDGRRIAVRKPLREWVQRLPDTHFLQIHRGAVVNLNEVVRVEEWSHGSFLIHLQQESTPLVMSRRFSARVRARLG